MSQIWSPLSREQQIERLASLGLHLNQPEPVIICCTCQYAIQGSGDRISRHVGEKHGIPAEARRGLTAFLRSLALVDPNRLGLREDGSLPHPYLRIMDGFGCKLCGFRSQSSDTVSRHLSKEHDAPRNADSDVATPSHMKKSLKLQSWTQAGKRDYWTVSNYEGASESHNSLNRNWTPQQSTSQQQLNHVEELIRLEQQHCFQNALDNTKKNA